MMEPMPPDPPKFAFALRQLGQLYGPRLDAEIVAALQAEKSRRLSMFKHDSAFMIDFLAIFDAGSDVYDMLDQLEQYTTRRIRKYQDDRKAMYKAQDKARSKALRKLLYLGLGKSEPSSEWIHLSSHTVTRGTQPLSWGPKIGERVGMGIQPVLAAPNTATVAACQFQSTSPWTHTLPTSPTSTLDLVRLCMKRLSTSIGHPPGVLLLSNFITGVVAQGHEPATDSDWRQRAIAYLTDGIAQCAFLVPPSIILGIGGILAGKLMGKQAGYALAGFGLLMAILYSTIHVDPKEGATGSDQSVRTAVGILYLVFMCGYCRSVILIHGKDKGTIAIATLLGFAIGCGCLMIAYLRDFVASSGHSPAYIMPLVLPSGFVICDVVLHLHDADRKRKSPDAQSAVHHEKFGSHTWAGANGAAPEDLRFRFGFPNPPRHDISEEEYHMGDNGGGSASQMPMTTPQSPTPTTGNWICHLFSKSKAS